LLIGIAYVIGGVYILARPLLAIGALTLLLAAVILAEGVLEIISYFRLKDEDASGWVLFNGTVFNLVQNPAPGGFPTITGNANMSAVYGGSLGDPCLLGAGSQITGSIVGSAMQLNVGGLMFQGTISGGVTAVQGTVSVITSYGAALNSACGGTGFVDYGLGPVP
jgi:hypothetical protein